MEWMTAFNAKNRKAPQEKENTRASKGKEVREVKERGNSTHIGKKRIKVLPP